MDETPEFRLVRPGVPLGIRVMLLTSEADNPAGICWRKCFPVSRHECTVADLNDPA